MKKHLTVSGFVSAEDHTLLHFHASNAMWLPPGGHIDPDEDPVAAVLREVREETGLAVDVLPGSAPFAYAAPPQLPPPETIMVEDIADHPRDGPHQHIDLIYFTTPRAGGRPDPDPPGWRWVPAADLRANRPISPANDAPAQHIPEDVRTLGLASIERARRGTGR